MDIESKRYPGWGIRLSLNQAANVSLHNCGMAIISGTQWACRIKKITEEDRAKPGWQYGTIGQWWNVPPSCKENFLTVGEIYEALDEAKFYDMYKSVRGSVFMSDRVGPEILDADLDTICDTRATYKDCGMKPPAGWAFHENGIYLHDEKGIINQAEKVMPKTPRRHFGIANIAGYIINRKLGSIFRGPIVENSNHPGFSAICTWIWIPDPTKLLYGKVNKYNVPDELPHLTRKGAYPHLVQAAENFALEEVRFSKLGAPSVRNSRKKKVPDIRSA